MLYFNYFKLRSVKCGDPNPCITGSFPNARKKIKSNAFFLHVTSAKFVSASCDWFYFVFSAVFSEQFMTVTGNVCSRILQLVVSHIYKAVNTFSQLIVLYIMCS